MVLAVPFATRRKEPKACIRAAALMYPAVLALRICAAKIFDRKFSNRVGSPIEVCLRRVMRVKIQSGVRFWF